MDVLVSILTTAYNHAPYIAQALDSFLMQKTDFAFEVIVHDDASTDGTAEIIKEYARKYPNIIKPILQTENQYSKGISPYDFIAPHIRGTYIAQCEGDDYWCDAYKLQKQADYMRAHPECAFCFCNSKDVDVDGNLIRVVRPVENSRVFGTEEILESNGSFCATAGLVYRSDVMRKIDFDLMKGEAADVMFRSLLALQGAVYGFEDVMVCYRRFVPNSWTMRVEKSKDHTQIINWTRDQMNFLGRLYDCVDERYKEVVLKKKTEWEFKFFCETSDWENLCKPQFREKFQRLPLRQKAIIYIKSHFMWAVKIFRFFRYGKKGFARTD